VILSRERRPRPVPLPPSWPSPSFGPPSGLLARPAVMDTAPVITLALALAYLLPPRLVISGIGAAGRPALIVSFGLLVWWIATRAVPGLTTYGRQPMRWALGLFLAAYLASYAAGYRRVLDPVEASSADRTLLVTLALVGLALAAADGISSRARLDRLMGRLLQFGVCMAIVAHLQFLFSFDLTRYIQVPGLSLNAALIGVGERGGPAFARVAGTAGHYIEFGVLMALLMPIAVHYALFADTPGRRLNRWIVVAVLTAGIPFSISRSAIVAFAAGTLTLALSWTLRRQFNAGIALVTLTLALQAVKPGLMGTIRSLFLNLDNDPSIEHRTDDYAVVADYVQKQPWLGVGQGTFIPEKRILLDNQLLGTLAAGGLIGLATLLLLGGVGFSLARRLRRSGADEETRHLGQALAAVLVTALVASATFDSLGFTTFAVTLFVVLGAIGALWRLDRTDRFRGAGYVPERPVLRGEQRGDHLAPAQQGAEVRV
jgi:O-antigen ligase